MISIPASLSSVAPRMVALAAVGLALAGFCLAEPASGAEDEPRLLAVQFDLSTEDAPGNDGGPLSAVGSTEEASYETLQIDHGAVTRRLRPLAGPMTAVATAAPEAMAVELNGLRVGSAADGFGRTLGDAFASASLSRFVRIETGDPGDHAVIELRLPRPLRSGDYLLVQEAGGDDSMELEAIGSDGVAVGPARVVGPPYRWNSGHRTADDEAQWATVIEAPTSPGSAPVVALRLTATQAQVKVLVLEPSVDDLVEVPSVVGQVASTTTGSTPPSISIPEPMTSVRPSSTAAGQSAPLGDLSSDVTSVPVADPAPEAEGPVEHPGSQVAPGQLAMAEIPVLGQAEQGADLEPEPAPAPTALAMTGVPTEPWVLVALATGLIFFGYTAVAALRSPSHRARLGESKGHAQLDALGFD